MYIYMMYFSAINATLNVTFLPEIPSLGSDFLLSCQVSTEDLLCPSGTIFLQLPNGTTVSNRIRSSTAILTFHFNPLMVGNLGRYYCNASLTSPEFPEVGLRVFRGIDLDALSK